jgi:hypothetical protein
MKKYLLTAGAALLLTAGVTATVMNTGKSPKKEPTKNTGKDCPYMQTKCCKTEKSTACY